MKEARNDRRIKNVMMKYIKKNDKHKGWMKRIQRNLVTYLKELLSTALKNTRSLSQQKKNSRDKKKKKKKK